jgi:polysaccharide biosynthesis/export protein
MTAGCGGGNKQAVNSLAESYIATHEKRAEMGIINQKLFAAAETNTDPSDYILGAGDLIQLSVFEAKDLNCEVRVSSRGFVTLPLLGQVEVKELTAREAESKIEKLYRKTYIKDPHIAVFVKQHLSQQVTLIGQVKKPGSYEYYSRLHLLDVLALAGGLTDDAGRIIQLRRSGAEPNERGAFMVDLDELIKGGNTDLNIAVKADDIIFVPEAGRYFVDGAVRRPGAYPVKQKLYLRQALVAAGGLASYADEDNLTLIRYLGNGERKVYELDLTKSKSFELEVHDRDVLIAQSTTWGKIIHGLGINLGAGLLGFSYKAPDQ